MFTGIVQKIASVAQVIKKKDLMTYALRLDEKPAPGASLSIDGVCQTVTQVEGGLIYFDAIEETLAKTTLGSLTKGSFVNIERAARIGDEIGGHLVAGHICCPVMITEIKDNIYTLHCPSDWLQFIFAKGFVALNGMSLTVCEVDRKEGTFTVHLIPETLKRTTMASKKVGDMLNLEVDYIVQSYITHYKEGYDGKGTR